MTKDLDTDINGAIRSGLSAIWVKGYDDREIIIPPTYTVSALEEIKNII